MARHADDRHERQHQRGGLGEFHTDPGTAGETAARTARETTVRTARKTAGPDPSGSSARGQPAGRAPPRAERRSASGVLTGERTRGGRPVHDAPFRYRFVTFQVLSDSFTPVWVVSFSSYIMAPADDAEATRRVRESLWEAECAPVRRTSGGHPSVVTLSDGNGGSEPRGGATHYLPVLAAGETNE